LTLLIFDCDGVLVDSEAIALDGLAEMLTARGHPVTRAECRSLFMGRSVKDVLAEIERLLGSPLPPDWETEAQTRFFERLRRDLRPVDGIVAAIEALPYPRCVASSSPHDRIALSLAVTGLAPLFGEWVFSAEDVAHGKPAPDLFLHAAGRCGATAGEAIVIEDSPAGILAARRAGMRAIGFAGASHADAALAAALTEAGAGRVLTDMADLPEAVAMLIRDCGERSAAGAAQVLQGGVS
jgi:HAD superfamily hydrolase (TIGR01509 family)